MVSRFLDMASMQIPIRELNARPGHYVRLASRDTEVIITESGKPAACIALPQFSEPSTKTLGERRKLLPAFEKAHFSGKFKSATDGSLGLRETSALRDL
jgi:antitoxin (DNA-binding transcriptional repressor) of toxin-antitoxin stability system